MLLKERLKKSVSFFEKLRKASKGKGEISAGRWTKTNKKVIGRTSEEEEVKAKSRFKIPGEIYFPAEPDKAKGNRFRVRVTEKLQTVGKKILRQVKKMPKGVVDRLVQGELGENDQVIKRPLELSGASVQIHQSARERKINWILEARRGVYRKKILVPLLLNSDKDGFVVDYVFGEKTTDISLLHTIISAALGGRVKKGFLQIKPEDLRVKRKAAYSKLVIVIVMDTSLSMSYLVSGLSKALLDFKFSAWRRRDKVSLIVCSGSEAKILFPPTNNINIIMRNLIKIKFGGRTPLADGMLKAMRILKLEKMKDPDILPLVLIISDGLANEPLKMRIPNEIYELCPIIGAADAIFVAFKYKKLGIPTIIVNPSHNPEDATYFGWNPTKVLEYIARVTGGIYIGLKEEKERYYTEKVFNLIFSAVNATLRRYIKF